VDELNIGMDAVVFVDDNPAECARIAAFLPELTVRQVPAERYDLPLLLEREGFFDRLGATPEDGARTALYRQEAQRKSSAVAFATQEEFLASLEMVARVERATPAQVPRIAQLTQKTNQFNLTTRRYTDGQVIDMIASPDWAVFTLTPRDRFGDLGLSAVLIARQREDGNWIDSMLLSCRILGRQLERQFVTTAIESLDAEWGRRTWYAEYLPSRKNRQVEAFWPIFGFVADRVTGSCTLYKAIPGALTLPHFPFIRIEP